MVEEKFEKWGGEIEFRLISVKYIQHDQNAVGEKTNTKSI